MIKAQLALKDVCGAFGLDASATTKKLETTLKQAEVTHSSGVMLHAFLTETKKEPLRAGMQSEAKHMKSVGLSFKVDLHPALAAKVQSTLQGRS